MSTGSIHDFLTDHGRGATLWSMTQSTDRFRHVSFHGEPVMREPLPDVRREPSTHGLPAALGPESSAFFEALCAKWGLSSDRYRNSSLARRQAACLRALRVATPTDGARAIAADPLASEQALGVVMIGVTEFFRDTAVFEVLQGFLSTLQGAPSGTLRALSLGCSNGSELYSLAMLMAEQDILCGAHLIGLDCRPAAVDCAREGIYPVEAAKSIPEELRTRYLRRAPAAEPLPGRRRGPARVRMSQELRSACRWQIADAFSTSPAVAEGPFDLIMCRNLAIYLTPRASADLWALCLRKLAPGGLLVVGKVERPPLGASAVLARVGPCIYRKR